jgi:hypothetical protein
MIYSFKRTAYTRRRVFEGVSVTKTGRIGLSRWFITTHGIKNGARAYMYWDKEKKAIAVGFTNENDPSAYPVIFTRQYGAFINASRFFRANQVNPAEYARRYPYQRLPAKVVGLQRDSDVFCWVLGSKVDTTCQIAA